MQSSDKSYEQQREKILIFVVEEFRKRKTVGEVIKELMEVGYSKELATNIVEMVFISIKKAGAKKHLKYSGVLLVIATTVTFSSYIIAVNTPISVYFVMPLTFLLSIAYFLNGLIGWLRYRNKTSGISEKAMT